MKHMKIHAICYDLGNSFDINKFEQIENIKERNKPRGGLWCSPVDSKYGWKEWCNDNEFSDLDSSFEILYEGNTIVVDSKEDLEKLVWIESEREIDILYPDFEAMVKNDIHGIFLTEKGEYETRFIHRDESKLLLGLYGWDCESLLMLNSTAIKSL